MDHQKQAKSESIQINNINIAAAGLPAYHEQKVEGVENDDSPRLMPFDEATVEHLRSSAAHPQGEIDA